MKPFAALFAAFLLVVSVDPATAQSLVRVPDDTVSVLDAIDRVDHGGVVELAGGTYASPGGTGFLLIDTGKSFTLRSRVGERAVLSGAGNRPILRIEDSGNGDGGPIRFENITFRDGRTDGVFLGAGVTVRASGVAFVACAFEQNESRGGAPGSALSVTVGSSVTVDGAAFRRNNSDRSGGAIGVVDSVLVVRDSQFSNNRVNVIGHEDGTQGGALYLRSSRVLVRDSTFVRNEAARSGGAISVVGVVSDGGPAPDAELQVMRSTFRFNRTYPNRCCPSTEPSTSGAIHADGAARLTVDESYFVSNEGASGGAIGSFGATVEVNGSVFADNAGRELDGGLGAGGAIASRPAAGEPGERLLGNLSVHDSLFLGGRYEVIGPARPGGCLAAFGDTEALGLPAAAAHRAPVELERVAFHRCGTVASDTVQGDGGAVAVELAALTARHTLFLDSLTALGSSVGGGLAATTASALDLERVTFAANRSRGQGGGLALGGGSEITLVDGRFFANTSQSFANGQEAGSALFVDARNGDVMGTVSDSLFVGGAPIDIYEWATSGNESGVRYLDNRFGTLPGRRVYAHDPDLTTGVDPAGLDQAVLDGIDKGDGNRTVSPDVVAGDLLVFPSAGASADPSPAYAAFAWRGSQAEIVTPDATLPLGVQTGVVEISPTLGDYRLRVDGRLVATDELVATNLVPLLPPGPFLAAPDLPDFRFKVQIAAAGNVLTGNQEADCISETVCVSGAIAGRAEAFLRVVGPRPNGFLQPILVKFSTSEVRIWIEQVSTGELRYYELPAVDGAAERLLELAGLVDRTGFLPATAKRSDRPSSTAVRLTDEEALTALGSKVTTQDPPPPIPPGGQLTSAAFPGFRFTVRITAAGASRLGTKENACLPETLCVSGAIPGRSEVFLRVVGPKPNGFLQPTIVRFSTSTIEVWIERPSTGEVRYYELPGVTSDSGDRSPLDGAIDREGFLPSAEP